MSARGIPFHCPYCGDENLRPGEDAHGDWECHACLRAFTLRMRGMIARPAAPSTVTPPVPPGPVSPAPSREVT